MFTPGASYTRGPITIDTEKAKTPFEGKFWPQYFAAKHAVPHISKTIERSRRLQSFLSMVKSYV
ncbi:hypothetical protein PPM_4856 [Paenibacillus polymyxa M1]|nr:hypothetical protein PPM_4856 [Paenibacillus polymyxa M1]